MKVLVSAFALFAFVAGTALPAQSYAQAAGTTPTMSPDTSTSPAPTTTHKKKHSSKTHHAKKKSKKSSTSQTSSIKQRYSVS
jgi:hypothetical protein